MKKCFKCKEEKVLSDYYKHYGMKDGHLGKCKSCTKLDTKSFSSKPRSGLKNYDQYRQRFSIKRILNNKYAMIKSRCMIERENHPYSCFGKDFLSKKDWLEWCYKEENYTSFIKLYVKWVESKFEKSYSPSIDRIDNKKGYIVENLQWLTQSQNSKKYNK